MKAPIKGFAAQYPRVRAKYMGCQGRRGSTRAFSALVVKPRELSRIAPAWGTWPSALSVLGCAMPTLVESWSHSVVPGDEHGHCGFRKVPVKARFLIVCDIKLKQKLPTN